MVFTSKPLTASALSRTISASSRQRPWRASQKLYGSVSITAVVVTEVCRYVPLVTMSLTICFTSQPLSINSIASQSSSAGCVGGVPCEPKSSSGIARPRPWNIAHKRFTITRAVSGLSRLTIHSARLLRVARPFVALANCRYAGTEGCTISPESSNQFPRGNTRTIRGLVMLTDTSEVENAFSLRTISALSAAKSLRGSASSGANDR